MTDAVRQEAAGHELVAVETLEPEAPDAPAPPMPDAPVGGAPVLVKRWFDRVAAAEKSENDGSLAAAHESARTYRSRAKAENTRAAYRSAVRAWCSWCDRHGVPALPGSSGDVTAFLAAERDRGHAGNTLKLRAAAIRFLHRAAGLPSPTTAAEVSETMAGIRRDAPNPVKKRAATLAVLRELLSPIPDDLRGLRDRALLLVGFAGALRRSELAAIATGDLVRTDQGYELTLHRSKGAQTGAVLVPLPYGKTELCPCGHSRAGCRPPRSPRGRCSGASGCHRSPARAIPLPRQRSVPTRSPRDRSPASSRAGPKPPGSPGTSSVATASSAARSPPACSVACIPPS